MCGGPYRYSVDWWSYGVTLYRLLKGHYPFTGYFLRFKIKYLPAFWFPGDSVWKDLVGQVSLRIFTALDDIFLLKFGVVRYAKDS